MTMKRALAVTTVVLLVAALFPVAAFGAPGGNGNGKGQSATTQGEKLRGNGHRIAGTETSGTTEGRIPPGQARKNRSADASASAEGTSTPKLTGIENALSRLQCNLVRMQAQIDAGQRTALPAGLVSVVSKFLAWLGIAPDASAAAPSGTVESSGTVEPADTTESTEAAEPTEAPEPVETPEPAEVGAPTAP